MSVFGITKGDVQFVANQLGLQVAASRFGPLQTVFEVTGSPSGVPLQAIIPTVPTKGIAVEVHSTFAPRLDLGLRVVREQIDPYDPLSVDADEPSRAEALLGDTLRQALSPRFLGAVLTDDEVVVRAADPYQELFGDARTETLVRMFRWTEELASIVHASRQVVPVATPLRSHESEWAGLADRAGLTVQRCPLSLFGLLGGVSVSLTAVRYRALGYEFELRVDFEAPLPFAFEIRPTKTRDRVADWFGAGDPKVGHAAFDAAFELRFHDEAGMRRLLSEKSVEQLLDLSRRGVLTVNERGLTVRFSEGAEPESLLVDMDKARDASKLLFANAFGLASSGSPYRM
jgi:hypothetical protein